MKIRTLDLDGGEGWVVDGAFGPGQVHDTYEELVSRRDLAYSPRAAGNSTPLLVSNFVRADKDPEWKEKLPSAYSEMWVVAEQLAAAQLSFNRSQINYSTHGELRTIHRDAGTDLTALYYANPEWHPDWLGETLIYDQMESEVLAAVTPIPGRMLIFKSTIPHRVGVPSRTCSIVRVGLIVRFNRI